MKSTKVDAPVVEVDETKQKWYIVNAYSGYEKRVANQINQRTKANSLEGYITEVLVPTQNKIVVSEGKKRTVEEKIFPGYVLVRMEMNDKTWQIIRNTEGVTGFVGTERKPTPLSPDEVKSIMAFMKVEQPSYQASFAVGDAVKVTDGPFKDFVGSISEINDDKGQVKVLLSVFGRETPVVLDFLQVTRL
jgi:transcriptional antiterminator NusG